MPSKQAKKWTRSLSLSRKKYDSFFQRRPRDADLILLQAPVKKVGAKKGKKTSDSEGEEDSAVETDDSAPKKKKVRCPLTCQRVIELIFSLPVQAAPKRKAAAKKAKSESEEESGAESTPPKSKKAKKAKKEETDESDY